MSPYASLPPLDFRELFPARRVHERLVILRERYRWPRWSCAELRTGIYELTIGVLD
jgi:hypothetical protein